jgi:LPXTG-motif cell wall-anchored protein
MNRTARTLALAGAAAAAVISCALPAAATDHGQTTTRTWYLPVGVDPRTAPFEKWWPQTVAPVFDVWCQHDTYRYETAEQRAIVDALDDDGLLTLDQNGTPEDSRVYLGHTFTFCNPKPSPSPSPSNTPTPSPTASETATPTPTPTATETATPSPSPTLPATPTPSPTVTPTTPETASSTTSPSPVRPRIVQADAPSDAPELAATGPSATGGLLALGVALLAAGSALVIRRTRRTRGH